MARKNDGLLWHLMDAPWWVSVLFAAIAYIGLSFVLPALAMSSENFIFNSVAPNLPILAPYVAFTLLIPAPVALFKQLSRQRQYSTTTNEIASQGTTAALNNLSWLEFESYIGEFFKQQGYEVKQTFSQKPDGGRGHLDEKGRPIDACSVQTLEDPQGGHPNPTRNVRRDD